MLKAFSSRKCKYNKDLKNSYRSIFTGQKRTTLQHQRPFRSIQADLSDPGMDMRALSPDRTNQLNVDCVGFTVPCLSIFPSTVRTLLVAVWIWARYASAYVLNSLRFPMWEQSAVKQCARRVSPELEIKPYIHLLDAIWLIPLSSRIVAVVVQTITIEIHILNFRAVHNKFKCEARPVYCVSVSNAEQLHILDENCINYGFLVWVRCSRKTP